MDIDIERILKSVKVEDGHIMLGESKEIEKYGHIIKIVQINWWHDWDDFARIMGEFLHCYSAFSEAFTLPDSSADLEQFRRNIRATISSSEYGKFAFKRLIELDKLFEDDIKWMKVKFSVDDWCEVFLWIYIYNILGVKKNLSSAYSLLKKLSA